MLRATTISPSNSCFSFETSCMTSPASTVGVVPFGILDRQADVDRRDQYQAKRVDRLRIEPPERERRCRLESPKTNPHTAGARTGRLPA